MHYDSLIAAEIINFCWEYFMQFASVNNGRQVPIKIHLVILVLFLNGIFLENK